MQGQGGEGCRSPHARGVASITDCARPWPLAEPLVKHQLPRPSPSAWGQALLLLSMPFKVDPEKLARRHLLGKPRERVRSLQGVCGGIVFLRSLESLQCVCVQKCHQELLANGGSWSQSEPPTPRLMLVVGMSLMVRQKNGFRKQDS